MADQVQPRRLPLSIPQILGLIVVLAFLPWVILTAKTERDARLAIEAYEPFRAPAFPFKFSPSMKWDPLGFMGHGITANFWQWTPKGLVLTEKGRTYFDEAPDSVFAKVIAGRREVTDILSHEDKDGRREVKFEYRWTEVSEPAQKLLSRAPAMGEKYEGQAVLAQKDGVWRVEQLSTPDFDKFMQLLTDTGAGVVR